jgi:L-proline amide hydrolase
MPEFVQRSFAKLARNPQVYRTMNGPTEFHVVGTLKDWEILSRLANVGPDLPVLLTSGRHDEATPIQVAGIAERLPQAEWVIFEQSGHLAHAEEPDRYMAVVADFLARSEPGQARRREDRRPQPAGTGRLTGRTGPE